MVHQSRYYHPLIHFAGIVQQAKRPVEGWQARWFIPLSIRANLAFAILMVFNSRDGFNACRNFHTTHLVFVLVVELPSIFLVLRRANGRNCGNRASITLFTASGSIRLVAYRHPSFFMTTL